MDLTLSAQPQALALRQKATSAGGRDRRRLGLSSHSAWLLNTALARGLQAHDLAVAGN
jgi:hypothetical protein